jgi:excisionase family DNA binding protein
VVSHDVSQNRSKPLYLCGNCRDSLWTKKFFEKLFCGQYATSIDSFSGGLFRPHGFALDAQEARIPSMAREARSTLAILLRKAAENGLFTTSLLGNFSRNLAVKFAVTLALTAAPCRGPGEVKAMTSLLRISDVQTRLAASRSTVYRLIRDLKLECVYLGSSPRIPEDSLERLIGELRGQHGTTRNGEAAS